MATKVVVCPECESPVEAGRFSCSSCGAVVAAIATVARSFAPAPATTPAAIEEVVPEPAPPTEAPPLVHPVHVADDGWDAIGDEPEPEPSDPAGAALVEEVASPEPEPDPARAHRRPGRRSSGRGVRPGAPATSWPETPAWPVPVARSQPIPRSNGPMWPTAPVAAAVAADADAPDVRAARGARPAAPPAWPPNGAAAGRAGAAGPDPGRRVSPAFAVLPPGEALPVNGHHTNGHVPQTARGRATEDARGAPNSRRRRRTARAARQRRGPDDRARGGDRRPRLPPAVGRDRHRLVGDGRLPRPVGPRRPRSSSRPAAADRPRHPAVAHEKWPINVGAGPAAIVLGLGPARACLAICHGSVSRAIGVFVTAAGAVVMIAGGLLDRMPRRHASDEARV